MSPFDITALKFNRIKPTLTSPPLETKRESNAFTEEFGVIWKKTPAAGVWYISSNKRDLTITYSEEGNSFYLYSCNFADFRAAFDDNRTHGLKYGVHCDDAEDSYRYHFVQLIELIARYDAGEFAPEA